MNATDKLIQVIDWEHPALREAKALLDNGQREACADAILRHFRTRENPKYLFTIDDLRQLRDDHILEDAQEVLDRTIYGYTFPGEIDWHFNPTTDAAHDNEWSWSLYRFIYWQPLARAYALTGDEKYPAEAISELNGFLNAWPLEDFLRDEDAYVAAHQYPSYPWRHIETAMRLYTAFIPCMVAFRESKSFDLDAWATLLDTVRDHCNFLVTHYTNHEKSSNWLTMETSALLQSAIMFPELKDA